MLRKPRILLIAGYRPFKYRRAGGPNAVSSPLIDALASLKIPVEITVASTPFRELGVSLIRNHITVLSNNVRVLHLSLLRYFIDILLLIAKSDLIHIFSGEPKQLLFAVMAKFLRKKLVVTFHGHYIEEYLEKKIQNTKKLYDCLIMRLIKFSDTVTFVSNLLMKTYELTLGPLMINKCVVPNGTDLNPNFSKKSKHLDGREPVVIASILGGHPLRKGISVIFHTLLLLHKKIQLNGRFKFYLLGKIPQEIRNKLEPLDSVRILPRLTRESLEKLYEKMDILVAPSLFDSFNLPAIEAASKGCAIVLSDKVGASEVLEGCAFIVKTGDAKSLSKILEELIIDHEFLQKAQRLAYNRSLNYVYVNIAVKYLDVYGKVLKSDA